MDVNKDLKLKDDGGWTSMMDGEVEISTSFDAETNGNGVIALEIETSCRGGFRLSSAETMHMTPSEAEELVEVLQQVIEDAREEEAKQDEFARLT